MEPRVPVRIAGTGSVAAGPAVTTAELVSRVAGALDVAAVERKTGIGSRRFAAAATRAADLAAQALGEALAAAGLPARALERLIFVSSVGGDALIPATASAVAAALGLAGTCDCFDLNNACMGFLTAFDVAARSVATGRGPVGIVTGELLSRFTTPDDPRPFLVLGDGVAAAVLAEGRAGEGILGSWLRNDGTLAGDVALAHPGLTGRRETIRFTTSSRHITEEAIEGFRWSVEAVLAEAALALPEVEWLVLHQPNGSLLAAVIEALALDRDRLLPVVGEVGSVGAASIAIGLDRLMRSGRVRPGDRILMAGVGAGVSYGAILVRVA